MANLYLTLLDKLGIHVENFATARENLISPPCRFTVARSVAPFRRS